MALISIILIILTGLSLLLKSKSMGLVATGTLIYLILYDHLETDDKTKRVRNLMFVLLTIAIAIVLIHLFIY